MFIRRQGSSVDRKKTDHPPTKHSSFTTKQRHNYKANREKVDTARGIRQISLLHANPLINNNTSNITSLPSMHAHPSIN
jgi:hypothetical protein